MRFSLILATVGRIEEVKRFLEELDKQIYRNFELIVVDQNSDDFLVPIITQFNNHFLILHLHLSSRGASRARNFGLKYANGDIITFPDDDCWYESTLLEKISNFFKEEPQWDGLLTRSVNQEGLPSNIKGDNKEQPVNIINIQWLVVTYTIFLKRNVVKMISNFDETLGVGAGTPWSAGEENDYLIRALKKGFKLYYFPRLYVFHPDPVKIFNLKSFQRAYRYGLGGGYVARKHYNFCVFLYYGVIRAFGGIIFALTKGNFGEAYYRLCGLLGRVKGWLKIN